MGKVLEARPRVCLKSRVERILFVALALLVAIPLLLAVTSARAASSKFQIRILSGRPDMLSGGDALVRIDVPATATLRDVRVALNNNDVTGQFRTDEAAHALIGVVTGLTIGNNAIAVTSAASKNPATKLTLVNHPITGPVFAGPKEEPFICETENFKLPSGSTLGPALDANCSVKTRVDYVYRSMAGGDLRPLPDAKNQPADVAKTTTSIGKTVPYIVRIETGTIDRGIYQIAMLNNPASEPEPDFATKPVGWNDRLIYLFGGGCMYGHFHQGAELGPTKEVKGYAGAVVTDDVMLRQGYAVASSTLNVFATNCDDVLAAETMMMVKERFIKAYGQPKFTIGMGCSGGSEQVGPIAQNYPGLLDGIIPGCTIPDVVSAPAPSFSDSRLLNTYFTTTGAPYSNEQKLAVVGYVGLPSMVEQDKQVAGRIKVDEFCPDVLPKSLRYNAKTNPKGARCDIFDHAVNVYGRDPKTGFARRPLDNVGIQYGLKALNAGSISKEQFLDLNEKIGGFDNDGNLVRQRTVADDEAVRLAYRTGRVAYEGGGLATTPVIEYRAYSDDSSTGDPHLRYLSFAMRARLQKANGYFDNQVLIVEDFRHGYFSTQSPVLREILTQMDLWLTRLTEDTSNDPQIAKVRRAKPVDLVDACWTRDAVPQKIVEVQVYGSGRCEQIYPSASFPRGVAGMPIASDTLKCQLKPVDADDYKVQVNGADIDRLKKIFPTGVCDWSKPGVGQQSLAGTWLTYNSKSAPKGSAAPQ